MGQIGLGLLKRFRRRFHQGFTKVAQVSWCLWSSGADPSWAAKRLRGRFNQGCNEVPPCSTKVSLRLRKFRGVSGLLGQIHLGLPKGCVEGSTKVATRFHHVPPRFHQGCASFVVSLVFWGRSILGCQKVAWKVQPRLQQGSTMFHQGFTKVAQVSWCLWSSGADPSWAAKRLCGRFNQGCNEVPPCSTKVSLRLRKFRYLSGILRQVHLGLPKGSAEGSTKVSPRFSKFCGVSGSLGQIRFGLPKGSVKGFVEGSPRFHRGSTKVSPWLRKFCDLSGLLGQIRFWVPKRFCGRFPHHFFKLVSQFLNSFLHFSPTALALGSSAIVKVLGQNDTFVFLGFLQKMVFASQKVLWSVPQTVLLDWSHSLLRFFGKLLSLQKTFCGGFRQLFFTFVSQVAS